MSVIHSKRIASIRFDPHGTVFEQFPLEQERRRLSAFNNLSLLKKNKIRQIRKMWRDRVRGDRG